MFRHISPLPHQNNVQKALDIHHSLQNLHVGNDDKYSLLLHKQLHLLTSRFTEAEKKQYNDAVAPAEPEYVRPHGCTI